MALADALRDMRAYAANGRIGDGWAARPRIVLHASARITRGDTAYVAWQSVGARDLTLTVLTPGRPPVPTRVPVRGQRPLRGLAVGRHSIILRARSARPGQQDVVEREAVVEVVHPPPVMEVVAPRRVLFGELVHLSWEVRDADTVELFGPDDRRAVASVGELELQPDVCGLLSFRWRAVGPGGEATRRITIDVVAPPVAFQVAARIQAVIGDSVRVAYEVSGAATLVLKTLDRDEPVRPIPFVGRIEIDDAMESERFVLTAVGHDGRVHARTIALQVGPEVPPYIGDFLDIMNGRNRPHG